MKRIFVFGLLFLGYQIAWPQNISEILYAPGAKTSRWGNIALIQSQLGVEADGKFGNATTAAVRRFQQATRLVPTGALDTATWRMLTNRRFPTIQERAEALTLAFEATDIDCWEWNYGYDHKDPSGATWGPFGLTVLHNEIQPVFHAIEKANPRLLRAVLRELYPALKAFSSKRGVEAKSHLRKRIYVSTEKRAKWTAAIKRLAHYGDARGAYLKTGRTFFKAKVAAFHHAYPIQTEMDFAFYWDLAIHTSGLTPSRKIAIDALLKKQSPETAAGRRAVIGQVFVQTLTNPYQRRSRSDRNAVYVKGSATVHGSFVDASTYGLKDSP